MYNIQTFFGWTINSNRLNWQRSWFTQSSNKLCSTEWNLNYNKQKEQKKLPQTEGHECISKHDFVEEIQFLWVCLPSKEVFSGKYTYWYQTLNFKIYYRIPPFCGVRNAKCLGFEFYPYTSGKILLNRIYDQVSNKRKKQFHKVYTIFPIKWPPKHLILEHCLLPFINTPMTVLISCQ